MRNIFIPLLTFTCFGLLLSHSLADDAKTIGIVKKRPTSGRFVETDRGFMVPYTTTIPGTKVTFEMVPVPGGTFKMGSPPTEKGRAKSEGPQVQIKVAPCWIGKHEVTWAEYHQYMKMNDVFRHFEIKEMRQVTDKNLLDAVSAPSVIYDPGMVYVSGTGDRLPAVMMTQYGAKQYTKWLSKLTGNEYRLPAAAEWEYACRAGTQTPYSFGANAKELDEYAWNDNNADEVAHNVGLKRPNAWGIHDMHGNVWEWVADAYSADAYAKLKAGTSALDSIVWPKKPTSMTVRGGSFFEYAKDCRSATHMGSDDVEWKSEDPNLPKSPWWYTSEPATAVGFRIARSLVPLTKEQQRRFWNSTIRDLDYDLEERKQEGRGRWGLVDKDLPRAIKATNDE